MNRLDQAVNDIAGEIIPDDQIEQAAGRVRRKLFPEARESAGRIRNCADYQALIPSYLARTLTPARALLLQDHTRECPACRRVYWEGSHHYRMHRWIEELSVGRAFPPNTA